MDTNRVDKTKPGLTTDERMDADYRITDVSVDSGQPFGTLSMGSLISKIKEGLNVSKFDKW